MSPTAKRITEGWLTYSLVEIMQRYNIRGQFSYKGVFKYYISMFPKGPLYAGIDESLRAYNDVIKTEFSRRWSSHKCDIPGCRTVLVFDGGCKATRKICGAVKSGAREFSTTGFKITTGCTNHPAPGEKFCPQHSDHQSPVMCPGQLSKESLENLNGQHTNRENFLSSNMERDNIFVVEGIIVPKIISVK